jgi:hypothetical protein
MPIKAYPPHNGTPILDGDVAVSGTVPPENLSGIAHSGMD